MLRRSPMKRRRSTPRRSDRQRDPGYMEAVRAMPCCARDLPDPFGCRGSVEADHAGKKRGMGAKADDSSCVPMCSLHHSERHNFIGVFKGWDRARMRAWLDEQIANTQAAIERGATSEAA